MNIKAITANELQSMDQQEGLILQGCGGDLTEWVNGINSMLTANGILRDGTTFDTAYSFNNNGCTCLLFPFEQNVNLDMGKLAIWRLKTREDFGSMWLSDYVPNYLGGFTKEQPKQAKPDCPLIGQDGNIFNLLGLASRTLKNNGLEDQARQMRARVTQCQSYDSALSIIGDYVNITSVDDPCESLEEGMVM